MKYIKLLTFILISNICISQNLMKLDCNLFVNNSKDSIRITIMDDKLNTIVTKGYDKFYYEMRLNTNYSILFEKAGCNSQLIYFNNKTDLSYNIICNFNINLITSDNNEILNVIRVYYDTSKKQFNYKLINF